MVSVRAAVLASLVLLASASPSAADWRRLDTPNFTVIGEVSAGDLRDLAIKFEGFREALGRVLSERATATAVPTVIIAFSSDRAFAPFKPTYQGRPRAEVRGYFAPSTNINYILIESGGTDSERVVFHEYAHLIVSNLLTSPPAWLNEGLAEFYSTFRLMDGGRRAQLGMPIGEHLQLLKSGARVPVADLLHVDTRSPLYNESARASVFYAESWALTHMILNGQPNRAVELATYLRRVNEGAPEARAWEEAFGTDRVEQDLKQYLARESYNTVILDFPVKVAVPTAVPRVMPAAEVAAFLGAFLVQHGQPVQAVPYLERAFQASTRDPRATVALAQIEIGRQQYGRAEKRLLGLPKTDDWLIAYSAAMALTDLAGIGVAGSPNIDVIQAARQRLDLVERERGEVPNVLAHRAALELAGPDEPTPEAAAAIARARVLSPGRSDYAFIQAQILARRGEFVAARTVVGPLMTGTYPPGVRDSARSLMSYIVEAETRRREGHRDDIATVLAVSGSKSVPVPGIEQPRRPDEGRPRFVPEFRAVLAGEVRLEGTLDRIDCAAGGQATFHLQDADAPGPLVGRLGDIDFIAYRDDLDGGVKCGVLPRPMRVFVTWRAQPDSPKIVVAVEFLPN
jgi:hypothetical protein